MHHPTLEQISYSNKLFKRGQLFQQRRQYDVAIEQYRQSLQLNPDFAEAYFHLGIISEYQSQLERASQLYHKGLEIDPAHIELRLHLQRVLARIGSWDTLAQLPPYQAEVPIHPQCTNPTNLSQAASTNRHYARYLSQSLTHLQQYFKIHPPAPKSKLSICYISTNFKDTSLGFILSEIISHHDPDRFHTTCYMTGENDGGTVVRHLTQYHHLTQLSHHDLTTIASLINHQAFDMIIDTDGFIANHSHASLLLKSSPLTFHLIGTHHPLEASWIDSQLIHAPTFTRSEKAPFPYLTSITTAYPYPHLNSSLARLSPSQLGLPTDKIILASFAHPSLLTPQTIDTWLTILKQHPGTILWLLSDNPWHQAWVSQSAQTHKVDPDRLHFTPRVPRRHFLEMLSMVDVYLEPFPANSYLNPLDALFVSTPVIALRGQLPQHRRTASILTQLDLPQLVANSSSQYIDIAKTVIKSNQTRLKLRQSIATATKNSPIFQKGAYTKNLEVILTKAWNRAIDTHI